MTPSRQPLRIAINGFGRIGRCLLRALRESHCGDRMSVVAINDPADLESMVYLTRFDSTHGRFPGRVDVIAGGIAIDGQAIRITHAETPEAVDWQGMGIDLLIECSGRYGRRCDLQRFIDAGCPRVLLSQPGQSAADVDATVIFGFNHGRLTGEERIVSNASCTTNAAVPVLDLLHRAFGIEHAMLTSLHSLMNDQPILDAFHHTELHRTRAATQSIIPVATGLARGVERMLPQLAGRIEAKAIRVPILNVSAIDLVATLASDVTAADINRIMAEAAEYQLTGLLAFAAEPHASIDFNHSSESAIVDGSQTRIAGARLANLLVWFDNEWAYANRLLDVAAHWLGLAGQAAVSQAEQGARECASCSE